MTIQRQYVLPNCSLVLEGLSADASNVLSILANAEFKIIGLEKTLAGGSDFFKAVVQAVSAYCQRLLSGLDHPNHMDSQSSLVVVEPDEGQYHRLLIKPEILEGASESSDKSGAQTIRLSTVQLFDMAEAIDQFYADTQTLPEFVMELAPLPRRYVRSSEPLVQRAVPPLLGLGTLAVAALGLFFIPVPELVEPDVLEQQTSALEESTDLVAGAGPNASDGPNTGDGPDAGDGDVAEEPDAEAVEAPVQNTAITDSAQLAALQEQLQQQISSNVPADAAFEQPLQYQISVAENGDIVGYNPLDAVSLENIDNTPLPALTYLPVDNAAVGPVAQFELTLSPDGLVEVVSEQSEQVVTPETVVPEAVTPEAVIPEVEADAEDTVDPEPVLDEETSDGSTDEPVSVEESTDAIAADTPIKNTSANPAKLEAFIATPIQDVDRIYELNQELRSTINKNRDTDWSGPAISYRVRLDNEGNITGYEADDTAAEAYATDMKIPNLVKTVPSDTPQLDFLVVISEENVVEVNPWDGWPLE